MNRAEVKCYDTTFFEKDADGRPTGASVFDVRGAKDVRNVTGHGRVGMRASVILCVVALPLGRYCILHIRVGTARYVGEGNRAGLVGKSIHGVPFFSLLRL